MVENTQSLMGDAILPYHARTTQLSSIVNTCFSHQWMLYRIVKQTSELINSDSDIRRLANNVRYYRNNN